MAFIDLFIQRDEQPAQVNVPVQGAMSTKDLARVEAPVAEQPAAPQSVLANTTTDGDIVDRIWDMIIQKNLPGPDYLELKRNTAALSSLPITEEQKIEGAFNVLKKAYPNFSKDIILKSIKTYQGIVNEEMTLGMNECKALRDKTVGESERRLKQLHETESDIEKQIKDLQGRLKDTRASIDTVTNEIASATQNIDAKERTFINSVNAVLAILQSDEAKISTLNI